MIVVKLMGGLGNQLFQYAAARALAIKHNTEVKVDLSFLKENSQNSHTKRELELHLFTCDFQIASESDIRLFQAESFLKRAIKKVLPNTWFPFFAKQKGFEFNEEFFTYPNNTYLEGFWQSEKFFSTIRTQLLKELSIRKNPPEKVALMANDISSTNSISLHIRRGDYITNRSAQQFHGNLSLEYYNMALKILTENISDTLIYVFSDDMDWVRANFKTEYSCIFVEFNTGENSVYDLHLMSLCKNNIIANSSFSWWAGWLNQNKDKKVIAPKQWFADTSLNTKDLLPSDWILL